MNYEPDDLIGLGDFSATFSKITSAVGKAAKFARGLRKKGKKAVKSVKAAVSPSASAKAPSGVPVAETASAGVGGIGDFIKRNPLVALGAAGVVVYLLSRRRKG